jgi:hypothetical protein
MRLTTVFATVACASAVLGRGVGWVNEGVTTSGPTGMANLTFEMSIDNGETWKDDARSMPLGAGSTIGFRLAGAEDTAVLHHVRDFPFVCNIR